VVWSATAFISVRMSNDFLRWGCADEDVAHRREVAAGEGVRVGRDVTVVRVAIGARLGPGSPGATQVFS
jgi:hypothetical protein